MKKIGESISFYILFFILLISITAALTFNMSPTQSEDYAVITIDEGDTLWAISERLKDDHQLTFANFVKWVEDVNDINDEFLIPGEKLIVPVKNTGGSLMTIASNDL